jgi:serine/threonine protein kinase
MRLLSSYSGNSYDIENLIRQKGKHSTVYHGINVDTQQAVVIKKLTERLFDYPADFNINSNDKHLLKAIDYIEFNNTSYVIVPYINAINAKTYFSKNRKQVDAMISVFYQLSKSIFSLYQDGWLHMDVKSDNILIANTNGVIMPYLIDFGMAKRKDAVKGRMPFSIAYAPPERILQMPQLVSWHSDIFSLCLCVHEWLTGQLQHFHQHPELMMQLRITQPLQPHKSIPSEFLALINAVSTPPLIRKPVRLYTSQELNNIMQQNMHTRIEACNSLFAFD